jgi:hypothetical protein
MLNLLLHKSEIAVPAMAQLRIPDKTLVTTRRLLSEGQMPCRLLGSMAQHLAQVKAANAAATELS